ncbi:MAG: hypothetical protein KDD94_02600 [Calditrichaeota bacterium]|nr:hypothetical protein [Calditrichota bacterium]
MNKYISLVLLIVVTLLSAERDKSDKANHKKTLIQGEFMEANNVKAMISNNGWLFWGGGASGFIVPTPTFSNNDGNYATVYASGIWLSGKVDGVIKTSRAFYNSDFGPGSWDEYTNDPSGTGAASNQNWKIFYYYSEFHITYLNGLLDADDPTTGQKIHKFATKELDRAATANNEWATIAVAQGAPEKPPGHLASFTIYHDANLSTRQASNDEKPLNVQIRQLAWSFRQAGPLNNTVFVKFEFINKNNVPITDMYATVWADPDLGNYGDDYVGSDRLLGLGYCYNGQPDDAQYTNVLGIAPPAIGYDYFQGPIVNNIGTDIVQRGKDFLVYLNLDEHYSPEPSDVIIHNKYIRPATSFFYFNNTDEPSTAIGWQNFMKGLTESGNESSIKTNAISQGLTTVEDAAFFFNGDPEKGQGWLDSDPNDRRFILNNGPFELGVSDGTEVFGDPGYNSSVVGVFTSFGATNTNSVTQLKLDDQVVQGAYLKAFKIKPLPPALKVTVRPDDQSFHFSWIDGSVVFKDDNGDRNISALTYNEDGYKLMAIQVVQYELAALAGSENFKEVAMFDLIDGVKIIKDDISFVEEIVWQGNDVGIKYDMEIKSDLFSKQSNPVLLNYTPYHFGVRAIAYNPNPIPGESHIKKGEWSVGLTNLIAKKQDIGTSLTSSFNDIVELTSVPNISIKNKVGVRVVDPYQLNGADYRVIIHSTNRKFDVLRKPVFGDWEVAKSNIQLGTEESEESFNVAQIDGLSIFASANIIAGIDSYSATANRWITGHDWSGSLFFGGLDTGDEFSGSTITDADLFPVRLVWTGTPFSEDESGWSKGQVFRRDLSYATQGSGNIPFKAYDMTDPDNPRQINVCFVEDNREAPANMTWDMGWNGSSYPDPSGGAREYIFIMSSDYDEGASYENAPSPFSGNLDIVYAIWPAQRGSREYLYGEFTFDIFNKPFTPDGAAYEFTAPNKPDLQNVETAQSNFTKVGVWPNPYRGWHELQSNTGGFMEFINLPKLDANDFVNIKIYSLTGDLIKNLRYTGGSGTIRWFLDNDANLKIATGVYIAYLKYRTASKVIKMAVNVGENRPKTF